MVQGQVRGDLAAEVEKPQWDRAEAELETEVRRAQAHRVAVVAPREGELEVAGGIGLQHAPAIATRADHPEQSPAGTVRLGLGPGERPGDHVVAVEADLVDARQQGWERNREPADRKGGRGALPQREGEISPRGARAE